MVDWRFVGMIGFGARRLLLREVQLGSVPERDPANAETLYNTCTVYSPKGHYYDSFCLNATDSTFIWQATWLLFTGRSICSTSIFQGRSLSRYVMLLSGDLLVTYALFQESETLSAGDKLTHVDTGMSSLESVALILTFDY